MPQMGWSAARFCFPFADVYARRLVKSSQKGQLPIANIYSPADNLSPTSSAYSFKPATLRINRQILQPDLNSLCFRSPVLTCPVFTASPFSPLYSLLFPSPSGLLQSKGPGEARHRASSHSDLTVKSRRIYEFSKSSAANL